MRRWLTGRLYRKVFICFLLVALVPLCAVYLYINSSYSRKLEQDAAVLNRLAERNTATQIEDFLTKTEYISNLFFNGNTQKILKGPDDALSLYNARIALEKVVRVSLDLYKIMDNVDQVSFVRKNGVRYHVMNSSGHGEPLPFAGSENISVNTYKNHILVNSRMLGGIPEGKMVYARRINDIDAVDRELGYLYVVFDKEKFDRIVQEIQQTLGTRITITNDGGQLLYASFADGGEWLSAADEGAGGTKESQGKAGWMKWEYPLVNFGLNISFYDEIGKIDANIRELRRLTETVIVITIAVILAASLLFSKTIVTPVVRLRNSLLRVGSGNFKVRVPVDTKDELGDVGTAFNEMAKEIDRLVNQVYTIQLKENEAAIAALQAQINPHFLYNTLDMIKSMAEIYGAYQVGEVIVALSGLFRYAAHTENLIVTVQEEIENLQNYMKIVNARFGGKIICSIEAPESLLREQIVKVCLQPLVENAISHGLGRGGRGGDIKVQFQNINQEIVIEVRDSGAGISGERLKEIREKLTLLPGENTGVKSGSVGLKNIHDRIRLYYGNEYGVSIESAEGRGTAVTVRYPSNMHIKRRGEESPEEEL